jgi:predicted nucleic acid-binding protein
MTIVEPPLQLVVDASVLVGQLLRVSGRRRLAHSGLQLVLPEYTWGETRHELLKRIGQITEKGNLTVAEAQALTSRCLEAVEENVVIVPEATYAPLEFEARWRIARDPRDWSTVALALALQADIWTEDNDFLGCGVATWTTATLTQLLDLLSADNP